MSNLQRQTNSQLFNGKGYKMDDFINDLLSHEPIPQRADYYHRQLIVVTLQYLPGKGFMVGFQDKRVSTKTSPIMMFADAYYHTIQRKKQNPIDTFRDIVMNSPVLSKKSLQIKTDGELDKKIDKFATASELKQVMVEVIFKSEFLYDKNSRTLGERPTFTQLKN